MADEFKKKFNDDYYTFATYNGIQLLAAAMAKAKSTDPVKVAKALEGMHGQELRRRRDDARGRPPAAAVACTSPSGRRPTARARTASENTGYTFVPIKQMDPYVSSTPTSCQMKRPAPPPEQRASSRRRVMRRAVPAFFLPSFSASIENG